MKKNLLRLLSILLTILMICSFIVTVNAQKVAGIDLTPNTTGSAAGVATNIGNQVLGVIQVAGTAIAVGMLLMLAIKYMKAAPDEKANIKQSSVIYIIGAVILFSAVTLVNMVYNFANEAVTGTKKE